MEVEKADNDVNCCRLMKNEHTQSRIIIRYETDINGTFFSHVNYSTINTKGTTVRE